MINVEICLLKVLKFFKKTNANNKRSIEKFVHKILHLKPINNKKQVFKKTQMNSNMKVTNKLVEEMWNETEDDDDDSGGFNDYGGDDDDDDNDDMLKLKMMMVMMIMMMVVIVLMTKVILLMV